MELNPTIITGDAFIDDRGELQFFNKDLSVYKRFYLVKHERKMIRAWHGHMKEGKLVLVTSGTFLVGAVNITTENPTDVKKFVLSDKMPKLLWIPPGYANGFENLTETGTIMFISTSTLEESKGDDIRFPFDKWNIWGTEYR